MKCEMYTAKIEGAYWWKLETSSMTIKSRNPVQHRKTALRQARRVAAKLGLEVGK